MDTCPFMAVVHYRSVEAELSGDSEHQSSLGMCVCACVCVSLFVFVRVRVLFSSPTCRPTNTHFSSPQARP